MIENRGLVNTSSSYSISFFLKFINTRLVSIKDLCKLLICVKLPI